jgi:hypothetical protein
MPDFVLNCAGTSRTTGTAGYVISGTTGKSRSMVSALTNGQQVAYHIEYKSSKAGFEDGIGTWNSSTSTLARTAISASSNADAAVSWGVGEKVLYCTVNPDMLTNANYLATGTVPAARVPAGTTADTFAVGNDPRFDTIDPVDMDPAETLDGTEIIPIVQDGDGAQTTVQGIAGNPLTAQLGHARNTNKSFSNFTKLSKSFIAAAGSSGVAAGLEPFLCYASGTGAGLANLQLFTQTPAMTLDTGTTTTGRVCLEHLEYPILYDPVQFDRDYRKTVSMGGNLPVSGNDFIIQCGFLDSAPEIATLGTGLGVFFELKTGDTNWQACWISRTSGESNYRRVDTGVLASTSTTYTFRVHLRSSQTVSADRKADFYINNELVASILHNDTGVTVMPTNTRLSMAEVVKKSSGSTGGAITVVAHYSEIEALYPSREGMSP